MFKNKFLLAACVCFVLISCKKEVPITFYETNLTSENNRIVEVNIPLANAESDVAKSINSAIKNHVISAMQIGGPDSLVIESVEESIESFNKEYNDFTSDFPESAQNWEAQIDGEVIFKTQELISISVTAYTNTGGAHGNLNISFLNFDASTGKLIDNDKLFTDIEGFKTIAKTHFDASVKDKNLFTDSNTFQLPKNIGYSDDGIVLLYNIYEIAPYATGIVEFSIPIETARPFLVFHSF